MLLLGNCLEKLKELPDNSIDSIVTDPPYGLSFMGKQWDYDVPSVEIWKECLRVLKPGGHLLSFGGTRTYHRLVVNIEDAGFEIRDQIQWLYGSGFPKSHDVSKAIDKMAGAEREVVGVNPSSRPNSKKAGMRGFDNREDAPDDSAGIQLITVPSTDEAKQWQGWGTALKPANEPICVARKPLEKGLTIAENVLKWGTGAINIDGCRISTNGEQHSNGRWPANLILDESAAAALDQQSGVLKSGARKASEKKESGVTYQTGGVSSCEASSGGASRFFYIAKASKRERNAGLEGELKEKQGARPNSKDMSGKFPDHDHRPTGGNNHPTVKPIKLMEYLIKLVTPPQGTVLDPFMGSGSTGVACKNLGFKFIGIEVSEEYFEIADKRIGA